MILNFFSSQGWEFWDIGRRPLIPERMPVLVDDDLGGWCCWLTSVTRKILNGGSHLRIHRPENQAGNLALVNTDH